MSTKISDTNMHKWKSDYTSSDTNTPKDNQDIWKADSAATDVDTTLVDTEDNLGAQLRNIKSVVKGDLSDKAVEKWKLSNPTYLGQSSDFLDKIRVDGNFDGAAIFSSGTKIFFTKTADTWNSQGTVAGGAAATNDPYREYSGTILRIDTTESTGNTVIYCQMDQHFLDTYYTTTATKAAFDGSSANLSASHLPSIGGKIYWDNPASNSGYETLVFADAKPGGTSSPFDSLSMANVLPVGTTVTMYKCYQPARFLTPLGADAALNTNSQANTRADLFSGAAGPTPTGFDTATAHSWEIIGIDDSHSTDWKATMKKTAGSDSVAQTKRYKNGTGTGSYKTDFWAERVDPIYITRNLAYTLFSKSAADAVNEEGFDVYVSSVKGSTNDSGQIYRRFSDSSVTITGDGELKEFRVYFDGERFSPGVGRWSRSLTSPLDERRLDPYSVKVQITDTTVVSGDTAYDMVFRVRTPGNQRSVTKDLTGFLQKNYQTEQFFTLQFEEVLPNGKTVTFDYCVESMDHARITPNGDAGESKTAPGTSASYDYSSVAAEAANFTVQWDPDNYKS